MAAALLFTVLLLQLFSHLINTIGAKQINELLWSLSTSGPAASLPGISLLLGDASTAKVSEVSRLRREVVRLRTEMNSISAQDDFARWARIRREHDKVLAEHDQKAALLTSTRSSFDTKASVLRWLSTSGARFLLQFWFAKTPVFALPKGWLPWHVEWILGFPRCPYGGVSVNIWGMVCGTVVALVVDAVVAALAKQASTSTPTPAPVPAAGAVPRQAQGQKAAQPAVPVPAT